MPPRAKKPDELLAVILDVSRSMCDSGDKDAAIQIVQTLLLHKLLYFPVDEVLIVLVGSDATSNSLHTADPSAYEHVIELPPDAETDESDIRFARPSVRIIRSLKALDPSHSHGDIFDAIVVAMARMLSADHYERGKGRLLVLTDGHSPVGDSDPDAVDRTEGRLRSENIQLDVFYFGERGGAADEDDGGGGGGGGSGGAAASAMAGFRTSRRPAGPGVATLDAMAQRVGSSLAERAVDMASMLSRLRVSHKRSMTVYQGELDIADAVRIPMHVYNLVQEARITELHNVTAARAAHLAAQDDGDEEALAAAAAAGGGGEDDGGEGGGAAPSRSKDIGVRFDRSYYVAVPVPGGAAAAPAPADAGSGSGSGSGSAALTSKQYVRPEEMVKAFPFGGQLQVVSAIQEQAVMRWAKEKHCTVLGFVRTSSIPRYMLLSKVSVCVPPPGNVAAARGLSAMARALAQTGKVALVRFQKRGSTGRTYPHPELGVLYPALREPVSTDVEEGDGDTRASASALPPCLVPSPTGVDCLVFLPLPWDEDIRPFTFPSLPIADATAAAAAAAPRASTVAAAAAGAGAGSAAAAAPAAGDKRAPTAEQLAAADALIGAMDLMAVPAPGTGIVTEALLPEALFNPQIARFHATLLARGLDPEADLPPVPPAVQAYLHPDAAVLARAEKEVAAFAAVCGPALKRTGKAEAVLPPSRRLYAEMTPEERAAIGSAAATAQVAGVKRGAPVSGKAGAGASKRGRGGGGGNEDAQYDAAQLLSLHGAGGDGGGARICPVSSVSTVNPIADFQALIRWPYDRDMHIGRATAGMTAVIRELARNGPTLDKAVDCVVALREGCDANHDDELYNNFMLRIKSEHGPVAGAAVGGSPFWQRLVAANAGGRAVTLFAVDDGGDRSVSTTSEEAAAFFSTVVPAPVVEAPPVAAPPASISDDLFGEVE